MLQEALKTDTFQFDKILYDANVRAIPILISTPVIVLPLSRGNERKLPLCFCPVLFP
jgi:hypothetical protein